MELKRRLEIAADGADALEEQADTVTLSPAAWERFNAGAVWCSVEGINTNAQALRFAVNGAHAVLEVELVGTPRERVVVPSTAATGWFWTVAQLHSSRPSPPPEIDRGLALDAVDAWAQHETFAADGLPRAVRLQLGQGGEVLRHDVLLEHDGGWLRGRRVDLEGEPTVTIGEFDMRELVLDISLLLAEALLDD